MARRNRKTSARVDAPEPEQSATPDPIEPPPAIDMHVFDADEGGQGVGDVIFVDPIRMAALKSRGVDTLMTRARIERFKPGQTGKIRIEGEFPPEVVTAAWLRAKFGGGRYFVRGVNEAGNYIAGGTCTVHVEPGDEVSASAAVPVRENGAGAVAPPSTNGTESFAEKLLLALLPAMVSQRAAAPQDDSLRDTINAMGRMAAMQMQMSTANALARPNGAPAPEKDRSLEILKLALERSTPPAPAKEMGVKDFLPILTLGMQMGSRMAGAHGTVENPKEDETPFWMKMVPDVLDSVGAPLIAAFSQSFLPPDKAKQVLDVISEHVKAKQAAAEATMAELEADAEDPEE